MRFYVCINIDYISCFVSKCTHYYIHITSANIKRNQTGHIKSKIKGESIQIVQYVIHV